MDPITTAETNSDYCNEDQLMEMLCDRIHGKTIPLSDDELVVAVGSLPPLSHEREFMTALMFYHGIGTAKSLEDARLIMTESADGGFQEAQYTLAEGYQYGLFGKKDIFRAAKYYRKAADQRDICASLRFAEICIEIYQETKIEFFADEALNELWDKAYGCDEANLMLAKCYLRGTAGEISYETAKEQIDYLEDIGYDVSSLRKEYARSVSKNNSGKVEPVSFGPDDLDELLDSASELTTIRQRHLASYLRRTE